MRLENKVAIITGAASGMGAATAHKFASEGAIVIATDIQLESLESVVKDINNNGGKAISLVLDVANENNWQDLVNIVIKDYHKIDILINNAGICGKDCGKAIEELDLDIWNKYLAINATGNFLGIKYVVPHMKTKKYGSIVNVSSINGIFGGNGLNYCSTKGANRLMARAAAIELAKDNIRVNSIHPGYISTGMTTEIDQNEDLKAEFTKKIPLGRAGSPDEIANLLLFLASDEASYITGSEIIIDGGWTATI